MKNQVIICTYTQVSEWQEFMQNLKIRCIPLHTWGSSSRSLRIRCEDIELDSPLIRWSYAVRKLKLFCGLCLLSLLLRITSREPSEGLEYENGQRGTELPSATCWSNSPKGRDHIDTMEQGSGMDTTSPVIQNENIGKSDSFCNKKSDLN